MKLWTQILIKSQNFGQQLKFRTKNWSEKAYNLLISGANNFELFKKELLRISPQSTEIVVKQSQGVAQIRFSRTLDTIPCQLPWKTVSKSARYNQLSGIVEFAKGELTKSVSITLPDIEASEDEEEFTLQLLNPICEEELFIPSPSAVKAEL